MKVKPLNTLQCIYGTHQFIDLGHQSEKSPDAGKHFSLLLSNEPRLLQVVKTYQMFVTITLSQRGTRLSQLVITMKQRASSACMTTRAHVHCMYSGASYNGPSHQRTTTK